VNDALQPATIKELAHVIHGSERVLAVGNRTKKPLSDGTDATLVSLSKLTGLLQYEPSEFTFTAQAGTPIAEVAAALAEQGQYLPFDPLLSAAGATIGGTVAAGISGPGRNRYGGIRDFLLGVRFFSSDGAVINSGGKVVKNAAGFDIPKLLVGSLGRLAVMTELTFKVFPQPLAHDTLQIQCQSHQQALERIALAASSRWEADAIDYDPSQRSLYVRIAGPDDANQAIAAEISAQWGDDVTKLEPESARAVWQSLSELQPRHESTRVAKIPSTPDQFLALQTLSESNDSIRLQLSVAGAVTWAWLDSDDAVKTMDQQLSQLNHCGLIIAGDSVASKWLGRRPTSNMEARIHAAMDVAGKFPALS
jgi:glycolate oxidase FAD binding subunit